MLTSIAQKFRGSLPVMQQVRTLCTDGAGRRSGVTKWFNVTKGFGYITPDDGTEDVFVHQSEIYAPGFRSLSEGAPVEYQVEINESVGKTRAIKVTGPNGDYVETQPRVQRNDGFANYDN